jgi:ABC-type glutathione transport system ATPase component
VKEILVALQDVRVLRHTEPTGLLGLWGARPVRSLDGVSLSLSRGETLGIMGGSGGGKTTLAETVTLRRTPDRGKVLVQGQDVAGMKSGERKRLLRRFAYIRQDARESLEMDRTVRKQFTELLRQSGLPDAESRIVAALEQVELPASFLERTPVQMSGGQQQRLSLARALALNPMLIAADEPVSGVDPILAKEMLNLLERVQKQTKLALLLISQDPRVIRRLAHRVAMLHAGRLYEIGPTQQMLGEAQHPYSRLFLGHEPGAMPAEEDMAGRVFAGCPWAPHCPLVIDRCRQEMPPLRERGADHAAACHALKDPTLSSCE